MPAQATMARRLCHKFGLQLVWFTNTLGHCDGLLANDEFRYLAEAIGEGQQLCPSHPDTRPLLKRMLSDLAAISPSSVLHVGGDEVWALNRDTRCKRRGLSDAELYLDHFQWVIRETKRLGKRPAMWADMLLKYPRILSEMDREVILFDWHYDSGSAATIRLLQQKGFEVISTTSTNDWASALFPFGQIERAIVPFMREARAFGCPGMCQTVWSLVQGAVFDNQWERVAAAPQIFDGKPVKDFSRHFFGSERADGNRLRPLLAERELAKLHPSFRDDGLRREFLKTDSPYLFYHRYGQPETRPALAKLLARVREARPIVHSIQRSAKRRKGNLRHLDLPLDLFETMIERVDILAELRTALDCLAPHRLPPHRGTALLRKMTRRVSRHIQRCEDLAARFDEIERVCGGTHLDALRLRRQIWTLRAVRHDLRLHARTYARGVPVPSREWWPI